jgi:hypothetical protein
MEAVQAGQTCTQMRCAFERSRVDHSATKRPQKNKPALVTKVNRKLATRSGVVRHKKMAYVTRGSS